MSTTPTSPTHGRGSQEQNDWSALMVRAQAGDGTAYRHLLEAVTPYLRGLCAKRHRNPADIEDTVQDILLTIHTIRGSYDPSRPFGPWLVAIAHRRIVDRLRRQGRRRRHEAPVDPQGVAFEETFSAADANMEVDILEHRDLHLAIDALPDGQKQAIRLLKLKEMSLRDAERATGTSAAALKVATHRALHSLRRLLKARSEPL